MSLLEYLDRQARDSLPRHFLDTPATLPRVPRPAGAGLTHVTRPCPLTLTAVPAPARVWVWRCESAARPLPNHPLCAEKFTGPSLRCGPRSRRAVARAAAPNRRPRGVPQRREAAARRRARRTSSTAWIVYEHSSASGISKIAFLACLSPPSGCGSTKKNRKPILLSFLAVVPSPGCAGARPAHTPLSPLACWCTSRCQLVATICAVSSASALLPPLRP